MLRCRLDFLSQNKNQYFESTVLHMNCRTIDIQTYLCKKFRLMSIKTVYYAG